MTPYKIPKSNKWVDLDTIQSIDEPSSWRNAGLEMLITWHHAFRDKPDVISLGTRHSMGYYGEDSLEDCIKELHEEVFKPFFNAWVNR